MTTHQEWPERAIRIAEELEFRVMTERDSSLWCSLCNADCGADGRGHARHCVLFNDADAEGLTKGEGVPARQMPFGLAPSDDELRTMHEASKHDIIPVGSTIRVLIGEVLYHRANAAAAWKEATAIADDAAIKAAALEKGRLASARLQITEEGRAIERAKADVHATEAASATAIARAIYARAQQNGVTA
ncbi:hypothetical protein [Sphingomonas beigongshangi]|uniref:hypothetical protein n=1 Tax=Sphingomonas beigongshangi TaxID=2782540 RepID=UPI00193B0D83|nr:hypothetical protein [Sphingomonas beigongshangi]